MLVYTGTELDKETANQLYRLRASHTFKLAMDTVHTFAVEAAARTRPEIADAVGLVADNHGLTWAERSLLLSAVMSEPTESFLARREIAPGTWRKQLEAIATKAGITTGQFVKDVRYEVLRRR